MTEPEGVVEFVSQGLLSKFGFEDGDMMLDFILDHDFGVDFRELLIAVVERLLVPRLDQQVETYTIWATLHNPIRAKTIDGEPADPFSTITPVIVEVAVADIISVARTLPRDSDDAQPTPESAGLGEQAGSSPDRVVRSWFRTTGGAGGTVDIECRHCGQATFFEARHGEVPPDRCPACGAD